jgi:hypothetical protein
MRTFLCVLALVVFTVSLATASDDVPTAAIEAHVRWAQHQHPPVTNYNGLLVPNPQVAIAIHCAVTGAIYGKATVEAFKPYHAIRSHEFWVVYGELPPNHFGTVAVSVIRASNGEVVSISLGFQKA